MSKINPMVKYGLFGALYGAGGVIGQGYVPTAVAVAAGTAGAVAASCVTGTAILFIPYYLLRQGLNKLIDEDENLIAHWILKAALDVGFAISVAIVGAAIIGVAATPIMYCSLAGVAILKIAEIVFTTLTYCRERIEGGASMLLNPRTEDTSVEKQRADEDDTEDDRSCNSMPH